MPGAILRVKRSENDPKILLRNSAVGRLHEIKTSKSHRRIGKNENNLLIDARKFSRCNPKFEFCRYLSVPSLIYDLEGGPAQMSDNDTMMPSDPDLLSARMGDLAREIGEMEPDDPGRAMRVKELYMLTELSRSVKTERNKGNGSATPDELINK